MNKKYKKDVTLVVVVFGFRKNLPLGGCNDTQAVEATFSSIKRDIQRKFPSTPTMAQIIIFLPSLLDDRQKRRMKQTTTKRNVIHDQDKSHEKAFKEAGLHLNEGGMKLMKQCLDMLKEKCTDMTLSEDKIIETYRGKHTKEHIGTYESDGFTCSCTRYSNQKLCRHIFYIRKSKNMELFDLKCFASEFRLSPELDESTSEMFANRPVTNEPSSPGMEHLIEHQKKKSKKFKKDPKFLSAFETAKVCSEYLAGYSNDEVFHKNLEAFKHFTELMREGIPQEVEMLLEKCVNSRNEKQLINQNRSLFQTIPQSR